MPTVNREAPTLATPLDRIGVVLSYIRGKRVDDWVEYTLNKVDRALAQGVQPHHEALWNMFCHDSTFYPVLFTTYPLFSIP